MDTLTIDQNAETQIRTENSSELNEPRWAVISFDRNEAKGLTYFEAVKKVTELDAEGIAGLCIVTDEAASRVGGGRQ